MHKAPILFYTDDDTDDLEIFGAASAELGAIAHLFNDGDELLKSLNHPPPIPSIVFVDLNMPTMSGYEIIREMKASEKLKDIPVIVLSTAGDPFSVEKSRNVGASYYIQKPTSMSKLKNAIEYALKINWNTFNLSGSEFVHGQ